MDKETEPTQNQQQAMASIDAELSGLLSADANGYVPAEVVQPEKEKKPLENQPKEKDNSESDKRESEAKEAAEKSESESAEATEDGENLEPEEDAAAVYAMAVNMGDNEQLTVGELKDELLEAREESQFFVDRENDLMRHYDGLMQLADTLPQLDPAQQEAVNNVRLYEQDKQNKMLINAIPDWTNPRTFTADKANMLETLTAYGVSESDLDAVTDHRIIKLAYDYDRLKRRLDGASKTNQAARRRTTAARKTKAHKAPKLKTVDKKKPNYGGNMEGQMQEIDTLLQANDIK